jgi:hypothetical protein
MSWFRPPQTVTSNAPPPYTKDEEEIPVRGPFRGLKREVEGTLPYSYNKLPPEARTIWRWEHTLTRVHPAGTGPHVNYWAEEMEQMYRERQGEEHVYGDMPLIVLAADQGIKGT